MVTPGVAYHALETLDERARTLAEPSEILAEIGSDHALIGGIAVGYHGRLRATVDVDLLVPRGKLEPLARALRARGYVVTETRDMMRVYPPAANPEDAEAIADLVACEANPVLEAAARVAEPATVLGHRVRIVPRGALVALKFHAAISPRRAIADRYQDVSDSRARHADRRPAPRPAREDLTVRERHRGLRDRPEHRLLHSGAVAPAGRIEMEREKRQVPVNHGNPMWHRSCFG